MVTTKMSSANPLFAEYERASQAALDYSVGENGLLQYNSSGLTDSNDPVKKAEAAITALSVVLVRGDGKGNPKKEVEELRSVR